MTVEEMNRDELLALVKTLQTQNRQKDERIEKLTKELSRLRRSVSDYVPSHDREDRY